MRRLNWWKAAGAVCVLCATTAIALPAQTFTTLVSFDYSNGANPYLMSLVQGTDGDLYGTTKTGGANSLGTVFKVTPIGALTTLYSFCRQTNCIDGAYPLAGLVLGTDGNFYGTTEEGGANNYGTVFSITSGGTLTTLHSFNGTDGGNPVGGLVQAANRNFYGTTTGFEATCGTVFSITSGGTLTTLHRFDGADGCGVVDALVQATNGNFYGTTYGGGANDLGTVFSITSGGVLTTLHNFAGYPTDGSSPNAALVQATNGNFYGTTEEGGANNDGTVFSITSGGTLDTLLSFSGADGANPAAPLTQASNGKFYGTTGGGATTYGTVFSIKPGGTLSTLFSFDSTDGANPYGGLLQATNGIFYGTTYQGGANDDGTIFSLAIGLHAFVKTLPTSGKVGTAVKILGTDLKRATSVTFDGTAATFTVNPTGSAISTIVPTGATSGTVQVVTPGGTLSSNVPFRVRP